jgi:tRNA A-37 threonylcarbamoyl transferase component Bud32
MHNPELIAPKAQSTPLSSGGSRKAPRAIPDDLLREASRRLEIMALLAAVLWAVGSILWHVRARPDSSGLHLYPYESSDNIAVFSVIASLAVYYYVRTTKRDSKFILNLGLVYMVLMAMAIGLIGHWYTDPVEPDMSVNPTVSWIGVLLLIFAAVIPSSPRKIVIAGFIAASMGPIGMLVAKARGVWDFGPSVKAFLMHSPDFILIGAAVVVARVVTRLGQQVSKAREMGSYQLGDLLKRGGMGEVYKATHTMLARPAAIKLIRPEMLGGDNGDDAQIAVKRFHREAEAAANLRSPHTVELFDFGVTEDQTLYFVMELLQGMDLESMVKQCGPLAPARVIHILRQVCESLEEAHARGLVHRDIKPANIHVGHVGIRDDFVKVLDFGLVKSVAVSSEVSLGTAVGRTPGTPAYMAPEMALGETVDGRADLYALGCVAYYLLTGKLVFDAENTFQMVAKHLNHTPVAPSVRGGIEIPAELEQLVLSCLAKNPDARPATAANLSDALASLDIKPWTDAEAKEWWTVNQNDPTNIGDTVARPIS